MVGTSPIGRGAAARARRSSPRVRTTSSCTSEVATGGVPTLEIAVERNARAPGGPQDAFRTVQCGPTEHLVEDGLIHLRGLLGPGEGPCRHVGCELLGRLEDGFAQVSIRPRMSRGERADAQQVR